jgi:hypothetical protein
VITMGLRAAPKVVTFAIYDSDAEAVLNVEDIVIPAAFEWPQALKYVRGNVLDIMREYGVVRAGVRTSEPVAQRPSVDRMQIEGVLQEAFASSTLESYFAGPISVMAAKLGMVRTAVLPMTRQGRNDMDVEGWDDMSEVKREAVLCALGAVNA